MPDFEFGTDGPSLILVGVDGSRTSLRAAAYAAAMDAGDMIALDAALERNVWRGKPPPNDATQALRRLVLAQEAQLSAQSLESLSRGVAQFLPAAEACR